MLVAHKTGGQGNQVANQPITLTQTKKKVRFSRKKLLSFHLRNNSSVSYAVLLCTDFYLSCITRRELFSNAVI